MLPVIPDIARSAEEVPVPEGKRFYIMKSDLEQFGFMVGCPGCTAVAAGARAQSHNEACRKRIEQELLKTSAGTERLMRASLRRGAAEGSGEAGQPSAKVAKATASGSESSRAVPGTSAEDVAMTLPTVPEGESADGVPQNPKRSADMTEGEGVVRGQPKQRAASASSGSTLAPPVAMEEVQEAMEAGMLLGADSVHLAEAWNPDRFGHKAKAFGLTAG
eukprot:6479523-Amphidinium_carterae.1